MTREITRLDQRELHNIAKAINEREEAICALRDKAVGAANATVAEAVLQGQDLKKAKGRVPHGLWQDWLKANCPLISYRTAARYMAIAEKMPRVADFNQVDSLRSAMVLCEVEGLSESGASKKLGEDLQAVYLISRMANKVVDYLEAHPLERIFAMNPAAQAEMRKDAEAVVGKLRGKITWDI